MTGLDADLRLNGNDASVTGLRAELVATPWNWKAT